MALSLGDPIPDFSLPAAGGGTYDAIDGGTLATVVVFTCNHCPYALAWHDRIAQVAGDDADRYPRDSFGAMRERVAAEAWPMPYLHDESQDVARAFGARTTPDVFVFDGQGALRYRGAPDGDHGDPSQDARWLRAALDAVLAGGEPERAETTPVGCSIKWKG